MGEGDSVMKEEVVTRKTCLNCPVGFSNQRHGSCNATHNLRSCTGYTEHQQNLEEFRLEKRKKLDCLIQHGAAYTLMSTAQFTLQLLSCLQLDYEIFI